MNTVQIENSARIFGDVILGEKVKIAQGTILRSEDKSIDIGTQSVVLENSLVVGSEDFPTKIGSKTIFGHKSVVLGASIGNLCEVGNGAIFMPGSKIADFCIFGEGTLIEEGREIPDHSVVLGRPGKIIRKTSDEDKEMVKSLRQGDLSIPAFQAFLMQGEEFIKMGHVYPYKDKKPQIGENTVLYETAEVTGDVIIGENCIIGSGVKIIGDSHGPVRIGNNVHILENTVLHLLPDNQLIIHDDVTIGPNCIIHGTEIGKNSVIDPGAILCDNSKVGENVLVKAGSLVAQRRTFEDNTIIEGYPAKDVGKNEVLLERPAYSFRDIIEE